MATQLIYVLATNAIAPNFWGNTQLNGSQPAQANTAYGPNVQTNTTPYWKFSLGSTAGSNLQSTASFISGPPTKGTGTTQPYSGDAFIAGPFFGAFAAGNWAFNWNMRATAAATGSGYVQMRVWRSINPDASSPTEIMTAGAVSGANIFISNTYDSNSSILLTPGIINLYNEYLFFQLQWIISGQGNNVSNRVAFRTGTTVITTPDFQPFSLQTNASVMA